MGSWREGMIMAVVIFVLVVMVMGGLVVTGYIGGKLSCDQFGTRTKKIVVYEYPSGCYVFTESGWKLFDKWIEPGNKQ